MADDGWKPIETFVPPEWKPDEYTAPWHGLLQIGDRKAVFEGTGGWRMVRKHLPPVWRWSTRYGQCQPTHYRPMPEPAQEEEAK